MTIPKITDFDQLASDLAEFQTQLEQLNSTVHQLCSGNSTTRDAINSSDAQPADAELSERALDMVCMDQVACTFALSEAIEACTVAFNIDRRLTALFSILEDRLEVHKIELEEGERELQKRHAANMAS